MQLFPFTRQVTIGLVSLGSITLVSGIIGLYGTFTRSKHILAVWLVLTVMLTVAEIVAAAVLQENLSTAEYDKFTETQFVENWKSLVADAQTDADKLEWIKETQDEGKCCGWLDASNVDENPAWVDCDAAAVSLTCSDYFRGALGSQFGNVQDITLGLSIVQLVLMITTFALICRLKEFYKSELVDFGDYVHVPFGKVRNLGDLGL